MPTTAANQQTPSPPERFAAIGAILRLGLRAGLNARQLSALEYVLERLRPDGTAEIPISELVESLGAHEVTLIRDMQAIERAGILCSHRESANSPKIYELASPLARMPVIAG